MLLRTSHEFNMFDTVLARLERLILLYALLVLGRLENEVLGLALRSSEFNSMAFSIFFSITIVA